MTTITILLGLVGIGFGGAVGYVYRKKIVEERDKDLADKSKKLMQEATSKAKEILFEAKNESLKIQDESKKEERKMREQLSKIEERLVSKEDLLDKRMDQNEKVREDLEAKVESVKQIKEKVQEMYKKQEDELTKVSNMSKEEARTLLLKKVEEDTKEDLKEQIKRTEKALKDEAETRAKNIIVEAIQKYAAETAVESTATIVDLPNDEMKGRIIGREGRNINTFEQITGIDVIVDDTPGSIVISGFDLIRRYIAKVALTRLIEDGRIHPTRIEETVEKTIQEVNQLIKELGEKAAYDTGVVGLHPDLIKVLGRLKFRTSNNQNVLKHSMEVASLAAAIASELKADVDVCLKAGLLHDIGKAVNHEIMGAHAGIGGDIGKKYGLSPAIIHAIASHHGDPGCGNFGIQTALKKAIVELNLNKKNVCIVTGIGCGSKINFWIDTFGYNSIHGRLIPPATGIKLTNPELTVIGVGGDGDGYGIGMGHFIHAMRRNLDITYIVDNNQIYGLTQGQASPTSDKGSKSKSTPFGVIEQPVNPIALALSAGATYVSRGFAGDIDHLTEIIKNAITHKGFSLVDVFQPCVTFNKINTYEYFRKRVYKLEDDKNYDPENKSLAFLKCTDPTDKGLPIGLFYVETRKTYEDEEVGLKKGSIVKRDISNIDIKPLINRFI